MHFCCQSVTVFARQQPLLRAEERRRHNRVLSQLQRATHFFIYLAAGAAMGGFLDVAAFGQETPAYGMIFGAGVAVAYQAVYWFRDRGK